MVVTTVRHPAAHDRLLCVLSAQRTGTIRISSMTVTDTGNPTQRSYTRIPALFYIHRHAPQPAASARSRFSPIRRTARVHSGGKVLLQDIEAMTSDHTTDQSKSNLLRIVPKPGSGREEGRTRQMRLCRALRPNGNRVEKQRNVKPYMASIYNSTSTTRSKSAKR